MKFRSQIGVICLFTLFFAGTCSAQNTKPLFDIEKQFCKTLTEIGLSKAFIQYIDEEGIMFVPTPAFGKGYYEAHTNESKSLIWEAEFAEVSADGNFAYTTGPWYIPRVSDKGDTTFTFGHFNTVWHKVNGQWKFLIDCGIRYDEKQKKSKAAEEKASPVAPPMASRNRFFFEEIIVLDNEFARVVEMEGFKNAYGKYASENIRSYRDDAYPYIGLKNASVLFKDEKMIMQHMGGKAAQTGDFAFSYGMAGTNPDKFSHNYMKVWKREGKDWKIVLDVLTKANN